MNPERWQKIEKIFQSALERAPEQRASFLDEACAGDESLRREVESLIIADAHAGAFIEPRSGEPLAYAPADGQQGSMVGNTIDHYRILSALGSGGMGEVYLAQDTRLGRKVALKLLPAEFTENDERVRRFQQEARAASALNHPNIVTVYDIGHVNGVHFIATEFIEGETLSAAIHETRVASDRMLELLAQVADGLAKAHSSGIVHRDLKPDNIMITRDGYAKLLDFGLAKLIEPQTLVTDDATDAATALIEHTQPGVVMGTAGYMSPEQAQGKAVDHRSDIFSFGCILYEAVTRHKPFEGDSLIDVLHKIVYAQPPPVTDHNPRCRAELRRVIRKCLVKDPERRYQSIKDVAIDLREMLEEGETELSISGAHPTAQASLDFGAAEEEMTRHEETSDAGLSDSDPRVLQKTRFSKASLALTVFGLIGAAVIWPAYERGAVDSELKLDCPKVVALSKAREIVKGLGYDSIGLDEHVRFQRTDFDLKLVASNHGLVEARRAVREGKIAVWSIILAQPDNKQFSWDTWKLKTGDFSILIDPQGRPVSFATSPKEGAAIAELEREQAMKMAEENIRRLFSIEPGDYETELIKRSYPPGVVEITWRNRHLIFDHRDVVRAELQGPSLTKLSRSFERSQDLSGQGRHGSLLDTANDIRVGIFFLAGIAAYALGLVILIRGKRWSALRGRLPLIISAMLALGFFLGMTIGGGFGNDLELSMESFFSATFTALIMGMAFLPACAGILVWLGASNTARFYDAQQLVRGRLFSRPVAASLVHGTLAGALTAGINSSLEVLKSLAPGYSPSIEVIGHIGMGGPLPGALFILAVAPLCVMAIALVVELIERMIHSQALATLVPTLLIIITIFSWLAQTSFLVTAIGFLSAFVIVIVIVHLYRSRGFAAASLTLGVFTLLHEATVSRSVGDPSFVLQSNLIVFSVLLLLVLGVWGYMREHAMRSLGAFGFK